jgi:hypothetical protein
MRSFYNPLLAILLAGACGGNHAMNTNTSTASLIATNDEARNAVGKLVRVRGMVQREKLGDTVNVADLSVRCVDFRFPDALVGQNATAAGTLEITRDEPATTTDAGEISQGTEDGISSFVIRNCVAR